MSIKINESSSRINSLSDEAVRGEKLIEKMTDVMNQISGSYGKISGIIDIIYKISVNINLLSLNASIEAARTGEAGS